MICVVSQDRQVLQSRRFACGETRRIGEWFARQTPFEVVVAATASYEWFVQLVEPHAELALPIDIDGQGRILLRVASAAGNTLRVRVNDVDVGTVELRRGFVWRDAAVYVPERAWKGIKSAVVS